MTQTLLHPGIEIDIRRRKPTKISKLLGELFNPPKMRKIRDKYVIFEWDNDAGQYNRTFEITNRSEATRKFKEVKDSVKFKREKKNK